MFRSSGVKVLTCLASQASERSNTLNYFNTSLEVSHQLVPKLNMGTSWNLTVTEVLRLQGRFDEED
ncbi:MAG: hypothetical protein ACE5JB_04065 [bacterium]